MSKKHDGNLEKLLKQSEESIERLMNKKIPNNDYAALAEEVRAVRSTTDDQTSRMCGIVG